MTYVYVLLGLALMWAIWKSSQPQARFIVRVNQGRIETIAGKITPAFSDRIREVAEQTQIPHGEIRGIAAGRRIRLRFSAEFSGEAQQQLRNWWVLHGWPAR